jgi:hypothetical protein
LGQEYQHADGDDDECACPAGPGKDPQIGGRLVDV